MKLKSLNCEFLTESDIQKLNRANIQTSEQLITYADLDTLSRLSTIPVKNLKLVKKYIIGQYAPFPQIGNEVLTKYVRNLFIVETGIKNLDELISNGIYSNEITEIQGTTSSGKTQFCFNLIVNMFVKYTNFKCLFIDSNKNYCTKRFKHLFDSKLNNKDTETCFKQLKIIDCQNVFHLIHILSQITKPNTTLTSKVSNCNLNEDEILNGNLLIIDNLTSLFNMFKSYNQLDVQFYLNYVSNCLKYLATNMNMMIVFTSNVDNEINFHNNYNSIFNESWRNISNLIIKLNKNDLKRTFEILKCNRPLILDSTLKNDGSFKIDDFGLH